MEQRVCGIFVETIPNNALVEIALRVFTLIEFVVRRQWLLHNEDLA